jgi:regulator-associated protein of mTOR
VLIFIWARILAVDPSCQKDLYANHGYKYFANVLGNAEMPTHTIVPNRSEHKAMCAFILASIARDFAPGQNAVARERVFDHCMFLLDDGDFLVRQWAALCLAQLWAANDELKVYAVDNGVQDKLITMLHDDSPEVRAGVLYALSTFLGASGAPPDRPGGGAGGGGTGSMPQLDERTHFRMEVAVVTGAALSVNMDASPMVRKELLVLASCLAHEWRGYFAICAWVYWEEARRGAGARADDAVAHAIADWLDGYGDDAGAREENRVLLSSFYTIYAAMLELADDAYPEVRALAQTLVDYVTALLVESPFARLEGATIRDARRNLAADAAAPRSRAISAGAGTATCRSRG